MPSPDITPCRQARPPAVPDRALGQGDETRKPLSPDGTRYDRSVVGLVTGGGAIAGLANATLIFAVPGSTNACATAWDRILHNQLDSTFKPCNFAELISRFNER